MISALNSNSYDPIAEVYDSYFDFHDQALFILDKLMMDNLAPGSRLLDLGCGTGHLAKALVSRGFEVTGIDGSAEMLSRAAQKVPEGEFLVADARNFKMISKVNAVISTFDIMNHIMSQEELSLVFRNVYDSLDKGGYFLFDLNMEEAFETQWNKSGSIIKKDNVCIITGSYDPDTKTGTTNITLFVLDRYWKRSDHTFYQKCHSTEEVISALETAGFKKVTTHDAKRDLNMEGHLAIGRTVFVAEP